MTTYKINDNFNIEDLLSNKYGFKKSTEQEYVFADLTIPITVDVKKREMMFFTSMGVVSQILQLQVEQTLFSLNIIQKKDEE